MPAYFKVAINQHPHNLTNLVLSCEYLLISKTRWHLQQWRWGGTIFPDDSQLMFTNRTDAHSQTIKQKIALEKWIDLPNTFIPRGYTSATCHTAFHCHDMELVRLLEGGNYFYELVSEGGGEMEQDSRYISRTMDKHVHGYCILFSPGHCIRVTESIWIWVP